MAGDKDSSGIADLVIGRQAERLLTLIGVPLLLLVIGWVASTLWNQRDRESLRDTSAAIVQQRVSVLEGRIDRDIDAARRAAAEAAAAGEAARQASDRARADRDAQQDRQLGELATGLMAGREALVRLTTQVEAARSDLADIRQILTQRRVEAEPPIAGGGASRRRPLGADAYTGSQ